jgi:bla regulator protein blaR1
VTTRLGLVVMASAAAVAVASAQQPSRRSFDVVSIKPNRTNADNRISLTPNGRVEWTRTTLHALIRLAYMREPFDPREIVGGPSWIGSETFTVIATSERPPLSRADGFPTELFEMVRTLVEDRFKVRVHNERREGPIYAMVLARGDRASFPGLRSVPDACGDAMKSMTNAPPRSGPPPCSFGGPPGKLIGTGVTLTMLGYVLSNNVGRLVVDRTWLSGSFDIELTYDPASVAKAPPGTQPGPPTPADNAAPSIFTALQEQLGLRLESTRGPVDVLVVDAAERPPPD